MSQKLRVLFVDDERNVLDGLRRMLRDMRNEWDMAFAESGAEALRLIDTEPFQVVVSDMRMPGMDGAELLEEVGRKSPNAVRIVLSGQSEREAAVKSVHTAHQYLAKPSDAETIKGVVRRACRLRAIWADGGLQAALNQMKAIPTAPELYFRIIRELRSPECSPSKVGEIISHDVGMTAKILQLVNSAFFGIPRRITSPTQAVMLLGIDTVKMLVLTVHIFSQVDQRRFPKLLPVGRLWDHSILTGSLAKKIAGAEGLSAAGAGYALMAGIVHDVGLLVMATNMPEKVDRAVEVIAERHCSLCEAEQVTFGFTHEAVGGYLLGLWGIPDVIMEAVLFHHHPRQAGGEAFGVTQAVNAAMILSQECGPRLFSGETDTLDTEYFAAMGKRARIEVWRQLCQDIQQPGRSDDE